MGEGIFLIFLAGQPRGQRKCFQIYRAVLNGRLSIFYAGCGMLLWVLSVSAGDLVFIRLLIRASFPDHRMHHNPGKQYGIKTVLQQRSETQLVWPVFNSTNIFLKTLGGAGPAVIDKKIILPSFKKG